MMFFFSLWPPVTRLLRALKCVTDRLDRLSHIRSWSHRRGGDRTPLIRWPKRLNFGSGTGPRLLPSPFADSRSDRVAVTDYYAGYYGDVAPVIWIGDRGRKTRQNLPLCATFEGVLISLKVVLGGVASPSTDIEVAGVPASQASASGSIRFEYADCAWRDRGHGRLLRRARLGFR